MSNKVYTKKGDDGTTSLLSGRRVPKTIQEIKAVGSLDELNSFVGLLRSETYNSHADLEIIQWNLFNHNEQTTTTTQKFHITQRNKSKLFSSYL